MQEFAFVYVPVGPAVAFVANPLNNVGFRLEQLIRVMARHDAKRDSVVEMLRVRVVVWLRKSSW